mgnify:CR=1 FL=1
MNSIFRHQNLFSISLVILANAKYFVRQYFHSYSSGSDVGWWLAVKSSYCWLGASATYMFEERSGSTWRADRRWRLQALDGTRQHDVTRHYRRLIHGVRDTRQCRLLHWQGSGRLASSSGRGFRCQHRTRFHWLIRHTMRNQTVWTSRADKR